jgi:hypothetical protein
MINLSSGLITLANGVVDLILALVNPIVFVLIALGLSLAWIGLIERDELDRRGTKPEVEQH